MLVYKLVYKLNYKQRVEINKERARVEVDGA